MCRTVKSIAVKPVVMREAKTWKSLVNAIIWLVQSRFGNSRLEVPLVWSTENDRRPAIGYATGDNLPLTAE
jgi:hypothetical protein